MIAIFAPFWIADNMEASSYFLVYVAANTVHPIFHAGMYMYDYLAETTELSLTGTTDTIFEQGRLLDSVSLRNSFLLYYSM